MTKPKETPRIAELHRRLEEGNNDFRLDKNTVCIFSAAAAKLTNKKNFENLTLPDRLIDLIRNKSSAPVSWQEIRTLWIQQTKLMSEPKQLKKMYGFMQLKLQKEAGKRLDLVQLIHDLIATSLLPLLFANATVRQYQILEQDQQNKRDFLLDLEQVPQRKRDKLKSAYHSVRATNVFRREIRLRAQGKTERQLDFLDSIVELLPTLGMDRAADSMAMIHTAVNGPPGAAAACLVFELVRQDGWRKTLTEELNNLTPEELFRSPLSVAPNTHAFVKETLRMWNVPILMRNARTSFTVGEHQLEEGTNILMSPYFIHRHPENWENPNEFDPSRWLNKKSPIKPDSYVPFGWSPKSCIGSQLGLIQLILLSHLLCSRFSILVDDPQSLEVMMAALPQPIDFYGELKELSESEQHEV
ncbi:cytochrome P450 [Pseudoalteromonas sp. T1lg75]|uniref:cytochrome P450 n=1 Tax=Pseudoalteromonas sp. T1lg75 TaxID=2077102 RepID=UPI000CF606BE|nr:cytochrome P450 [Pseudoalteromonas sp. T1lg75]